MREQYIDPSNLDDFVSSLAGRLASTRSRRPLPDMSRAALVLLDLQAIFVDPASPAFLPAWPAVEPGVRALAHAFGAAGAPVIRTRHVHPAGDDGGSMGFMFGRLLSDGDPLASFAPGHAPARGDIVLDKPRHSAFTRTQLARSLNARDVRVVVLAGVQAHLCVLATAVEAGSADLVAVIAMDAVAAPTRALHEATLDALSGGICLAASVDEILKALARSRT